MNKFFLKEVLKGKSIGRAMLFVSLKELFRKEKWLNSDFNILEIGDRKSVV